MKDIRYENQFGDSISLNSFLEYGAIEDITGLTALKVKDTTTQGYRQDGDTLEYSQLEPQDIEIKFWIDAMTESRYLEIRDQFNRVFRPKSKGTLYYTDGKQDVIVNCHVVTSPDMPENGVYQVKDGIVELQANDPKLYDREEHMIELTSWEGGFTLPTSLSFACRHRGAGIVMVDNDGHLDIPMRIEFSGPATNPKVQNLTTGEEIEISGSLLTGEQIVITTDYHKKTVTKIASDGTETNGETWITDGSKFLWLAIGENRLKYGSSNESQVNEVTVYYRRAYTGV